MGAAVLALLLSACPAGAAPRHVYKGWPFAEVEAKSRQKETAQALGVAVERVVDLGGGVTLKLVLIPAGEFMMGGDQPAATVATLGTGETTLFQDEHPQHRVRITRPFRMGVFEVTNAQ